MRFFRYEWFLSNSNLRRVVNGYENRIKWKTIVVVVGLVEFTCVLLVLPSKFRNACARSKHTHTHTLTQRPGMERKKAEWKSDSRVLECRYSQTRVEVECKRTFARNIAAIRLNRNIYNTWAQCTVLSTLSTNCNRFNIVDANSVALAAFAVFENICVDFFFVAQPCYFVCCVHSCFSLLRTTGSWV